MPGPSSQMRAPRCRTSVATRTEMPADSGVCGKELDTRLSAPAEGMASSPSTSGVPGPSNTSMLMSRAGATDLAPCTAPSMASTNRSKRLRLKWALRVEAGQPSSRSSTADQSAHARLDAVINNSDVRAPPWRVQLGKNRGWWSTGVAQFVAGVGDEAAIRSQVRAWPRDYDEATARWSGDIP